MKSMSYEELVELRDKIDKETARIEQQYAPVLSQYWNLKNRRTQIIPLILKYEKEFGEKDKLNLKATPPKVSYQPRRGRSKSN